MNENFFELYKILFQVYAIFRNLWSMLALKDVNKQQFITCL